MKDFVVADLCAMPAVTAAYAKTTFAGSVGSKWIPAGLAALFMDMSTIFDELFFIVVLLWGCDFVIGALRAWHDPDVGFQFAKAYQSVLKLLVIGIGTYAAYLIERLILQSGVDPQEKVVGAVLIVIGISEAISILGNLVYFFPRLSEVAGRVKDLLGKAQK